MASLTEPPFDYFELSRGCSVCDYGKGGLYLGAWWTIRLELVCIHITRFQQNNKV